MALAFVHMKSRKSFPVIMPWSASEWCDQIESRLLGEIGPMILLVDEKGAQYSVRADEIEFVTIPIEGGSDASE